MNLQPANHTTTLVLFRVDEGMFALRLEAVERVLWMVDLLPLPEAPGALRGFMNYHGRAVAVADVRRRMGWPVRAFITSDRLIVGRTATRLLALAADAVEDVLELPSGEIEPAAAAIPSAWFLQGVTSASGQVLLIHDLERWLSEDEEHYLQMALESEADR